MSGAPPHAPPDKRRALLADTALLGVALLWGLNFVVIKDAIAETGPMTYLVWRHVVAAVLLAAVMPRTVRRTTRREPGPRPWRRTPSLVRLALVGGGPPEGSGGRVDWDREDGSSRDVVLPGSRASGIETVTAVDRSRPPVEAFR